MVAVAAVSAQEFTLAVSTPAAPVPGVSVDAAMHLAAIREVSWWIEPACAGDDAEVVIMARLAAGAAPPGEWMVIRADGSDAETLQAITSTFARYLAAGLTGQASEQIKRLLGRPGGFTAGQAAEAMRMTGWEARVLLDYLTGTGAAAVTGTGPAARWSLPPGGTGITVMTGLPRTYTHPDVSTLGVEQGWAEPETDPTRIDWRVRQARAAIPFEVVDGRPVNPCASTGIRHGRNELGLWGENLMADALVTRTCGYHRHLLMVERDDGYGWAVPGGAAEPGETAVQAALRELAEETRFTVDPETARAGNPVYMPDPRASDEAWAVTVPVAVDLGGGLLGLPYVEGSDDARRAEWIRAGCYADLEAALRQVYGGRVFAAHTGMLRDFLGGDLAAGPASARESSLCGSAAARISPARSW